MAIRKVISRSIEDNTVAATDFQGAVTALSNAGNLTFSSTGQRIVGDFTNSTVANRVAFQSSTTNGATAVLVLPNGTSTNAGINIANNSDPTNASCLTLNGLATECRINSAYFGSGTYLPLTLYTSGAERLRITTGGDVGIGTNSPAQKLHITSSTNRAYSVVESTATTLGPEAGLQLKTANRNFYLFTDYDTQSLNIYDATAASFRMRVASTGSVGIATTTPLGLLDLGFGTQSYNPTHKGDLRIRSTGVPGISSAGGIEFMASGYENGFGYRISSFDETGGSTPLVIQSRTNSASWTERIRIDSSGNLLVGATTTTDSDSVGIRIRPGAASSPITCTFNSPSSGSTYHLYNLHASASGYRFYVNYNGGIANYSANNTNLSDLRTKDRIELAGGYLDKICAIPVKLFNYKGEPEGSQKSVGVIAQEVEAIAPELVSNDGFGELPEDGVPLKTIYQTDLQFALMKAIQELKAENDALKQRLDAAGL